MALPWLIGLGVAAAVAAVAASSDDEKPSSKSSYDNDDDEYDEAEREKAARKAARKNLSREFKQRCEIMQNEIAQSLEPYFLLEFHGHEKLKHLTISESMEDTTSDYFHLNDAKFGSKFLKKTADNLAYVEQCYHIDISDNVELNRILQSINDYDADIQAAKDLQKAILETKDAVKQFREQQQ